MSPGSVVVGVGLSTRATAEEVRALVTAVLAEQRLDLDDVTAIATRARFAADERLRLGPDVVGVPDEVLVESSEPPGRVVGLPARVAETAALVVAGSGDLLVATQRSAHVTVAVAPAGPAAGSGEHRE
jgi:cobalamin biosynthesis protein CbiG